MKDPNPKIRVLFYFLILLLIFPALFLNLGLMPVSGDEGTRALVSMEMEYSGNYITPTINGEFYFNKPPLYNWVLMAFFKISNSHSEFIVRLPAVISLLLFGLTIFLSFFKKYGTRAAFLSALVFISCGRILFYDSMNGYIDITFSWFVFLNFILIYRFYRREQFFALFAVSYFLCAVCFLMKGLPALLFQGISLLVLFISFRNFKKLFSFAHLSGIIIFFLLAGSYYYALFQQNPNPGYFSTLVDESAKRTFVEYGFLRTLSHLFTYPAEQIYHLFPWSLLLIVLLSKKTLQFLKNDEFLKYLGLIFIFNIPVYWISVESYPRYIFSLYPVFLSICIIVYVHFRDQIPVLIKLTERLIALSLLLLIPLSLLFPEFYEFIIIQNPIRLMTFGSGFILLILLTYYFFAPFRLEITILALLLFRIGFNFIALPERYSESRSVMQKIQAEKVGELSKEKELFLAPFAPSSHETSFYIAGKTGKILPRCYTEPQPGDYFIFDNRDKIKDNESVIFTYETRWRNSVLRLSEIK